MAIDWGFEIFFLVIFTIGFVLFTLLWEQTKKGKKAEGGRVKCQCGFEYEGKTLPLRCPQCERKLYETQNKNQS